ncbi:MAG: CPBP family intramembrane glutamic endopeptidase [Christensenellales bacterium]|jgi:membrane protease YdiL (CAAX protease family)
MNNKAKDLGKVALGVAMMFGLHWLYAIVLRPYLPFSEAIKGVVGLAVLYGPGLGLFVLITKNVSKHPYAHKGKGKVSIKTVFLCFLLQCTAFTILNALTIATSVFGGAGSSADTTPMTASMLFMLLLFNPVVEEFVFRHLFATRLLQHGERLYVLASAYCFAVVHGVSVGFVHIIYTFILGLIWGYLTVKSGNLVLAIVMHAVSNLFNAVIIQLLLDTSSMNALAAYSLLIAALGVIGLILFFKNRKEAVLDDAPGLIDKQAVKDLFTNKGILFYTALTLVAMVLKGVIVSL